MATIIIKTIGSGVGRDYPTISAWNNATKTLNLVALDQIQIGECYNDSAFTESVGITFSGAVTNSTHYRKLTVAEGHRHLGNLAGGVNVTYTGTANNINFFTISEAYFKLEWLRFHRETVPTNNNAATVIYCPGSNSAKYITINSIIINNWITHGDYGHLFGIYLDRNGGCKILNSLICNLHKSENTDADDASEGGIYVTESSSPVDSYIINCTVLNVTCKTNYMKASGGIGGRNPNVHIWNNISIVRRYVYDQSSIPNATVEDYSFDFASTAAADSGYNCERGGGHLQTNNPPGASPNHSLVKKDPFSIFVFPGPSASSGNGFYGYPWLPKSNLYGKGSYPNDGSIYQVAYGESGKIAFYGVQVYEMVAGYAYVDNNSYGDLLALTPDGYDMDWRHLAYNDFPSPTRILNGVFSYNRDTNSFTLDSGDVELASAIEMFNGVIQFANGRGSKQDYITTNWSSLPTFPSGGSYEPADAPYDKPGLRLIKNNFTGPAIVCIGQEWNNSFRYAIIERNLLTPQDLHLKHNSPCIGAGLPMDLLQFPELGFDIAGETRTVDSWDIGAFKYTGTLPPPPPVFISSGVDLKVEVQVILTHTNECNLWVGFEADNETRSWKVFYAEKPYSNYILVADYEDNPMLFSLYKDALIMENVDIENRVMIQGLTSGKLYKVKVLGYK